MKSQDFKIEALFLRLTQFSFFWVHSNWLLKMSKFFKALHHAWLFYVIIWRSNKIIFRSVKFYFSKIVLSYIISGTWQIILGNVITVKLSVRKRMEWNTKMTTNGSVIFHRVTIESLKSVRYATKLYIPSSDSIRVEDK